MLVGGCFGSVQVGRCTAPSVGDSESVAQDDFAAGRADGAADPLLPVGRGPRASPRGHPLPQREGTAGGEVGSVSLPLALACLSSGTGWPSTGSERSSGPCSLRRRARWFSNVYIPFLLLSVPGSWCDEEGWLLLRGCQGHGVSLSLFEPVPNVTALQLGLQLPAMDDLRHRAGQVKGSVSVSNLGADHWIVFLKTSWEIPSRFLTNLKYRDLCDKILQKYPPTT